MAKNVVFNVFPCSTRGWCACRADGLVCGYFVDQAGAVRFARRGNLRNGRDRHSQCIARETLLWLWRHNDASLQQYVALVKSCFVQ